MTAPAEQIDEQPTDEERPARWGALSYPNYRRYWLANVTRVFGIQFRFIGTAWLVKQITDDIFWLGLPGLVTAIATIAVTIPAGALADRLDNLKLAILGQAMSTAAYFVLAALVLSGVIELWMVLAWSGVTGALTGLTNPAQQAMLPRLIDRRQMASAVAYQATIWNSMRFVGPGAAGLIITVVDIGAAFAVTTVTFALSTLLLMTLRLEPLPAERYERAAESGMLEGVRYVLTHPLFLATVGLSFFTSIFGQSYVVLLPVYAEDIMGVDAWGFGLMEAAPGVGALIGTFAIVKIGAGKRAGVVMLGAAAIYGLWVAAFAASRVLPLSMALLFAGGAFAAVYLNLGMTTLQLRVPDHLRGRVMGVWGMTWFLSSVGGSVAAVAAEFIGVEWTVTLGGLAVSAFAAVLYLASSELRGQRELSADPEPEPAPAPQRS